MKPARNQYDVEILRLAQEPHWPTGRSSTFTQFMWFASRQGIIDAYTHVNRKNRVAFDILDKKIDKLAAEFVGGNRRRSGRSPRRFRGGQSPKKRARGCGC